MELFRKRKANDNYTIIIGCGRLGANIANSLSDEDGNVLVIDKNKEAFRKLSPSFGGLTITGDATDLDVLQEAQINKAETLVAVTNNDNANIMVSQMARELYKTHHIIARLYDPDRECVYQELSIDTICPATLSAKEVDKLLSKTTDIEDKKVQYLYQEEAK